MTIKVFIIALLLIICSCSEQKKDLSPILQKYHASISSNNQNELDRVLSYMDVCEDDSIVIAVKLLIVDLNKIEKEYIRQINASEDERSIQFLYNSFPDTVLKSKPQKRVLNEHSLISLKDDNQEYTLSEMKLIATTNIILFETEVRADILSQYSIDCWKK